MKLNLLLFFAAFVLVSCGDDPEDVIGAHEHSRMRPRAYPREAVFLAKFYGADTDSIMATQFKQNISYVFDEDVDTCIAHINTLDSIFRALPLPVKAEDRGTVSFVPGDHLSQAGRYQTGFHYRRVTIWTDGTLEFEDALTGVVDTFWIEGATVDSTWRYLGILKSGELFPHGIKFEDQCKGFEKVMQAITAAEQGALRLQKEIYWWEGAPTVSAR